MRGRFGLLVYYLFRNGYLLETDCSRIDFSGSDHDL